MERGAGVKFENLRITLRQIRELTRAQMIARYRKTWAGFFWVILSPILIYGVQAVVFKHVLKIEVIDYSVFLLGGLLPWVFTVTSLEMGIPSLSSARQVLTVFRINPVVIVASSLLDNWVNFVAAFLVVLIPNLFFKSTLSWGLFLLPLAAISLLIGVAGLVSILSLMNVFFRDVRHLVHLVTHILFFLTPIFYPEAYLPASLRWIAFLNPVYALIRPIRECVYQFSAPRFWSAMTASALVAMGLAALSTYYWVKKRNELYHAL